MNNRTDDHLFAAEIYDTDDGRRLSEFGYRVRAKGAIVALASLAISVTANAQTFDCVADQYLASEDGVWFLKRAKEGYETRYTIDTDRGLVVGGVGAGTYAIATIGNTENEAWVLVQLPESGVADAFLSANLGLIRISTWKPGNPFFLQVMGLVWLGSCELH